jgi:ribosome-associated toxin RatA of RatAB toxin-antitoxin module
MFPHLPHQAPAPDEDQEQRKTRNRGARGGLNRCIFPTGGSASESRLAAVSLLMHTGTSIVMQAPVSAIFETAANLELWPEILPHYRYIKYLERGADRNIVVMAAMRSGIPISWTSEQTIDRERREVRFHHLKAFTKGMRVVWTFEETPDGVLVKIIHDLRFRVPALTPVADRIIGGFFIDHIANQTLRCIKAHLEA